MAPQCSLDLHVFLVQFLRTFGGGGGGGSTQKALASGAPPQTRMGELPMHFLNERTVSLVLPYILTKFLEHYRGGLSAL